MSSGNRVVVDGRKARAKIELHSGKGARLIAPRNAALLRPPDSKIGGKRGAILKWSTASRRRMREVLLTHEPVEGCCKPFGFTATIPGPVLTISEHRVLWHGFCRDAERQGFGFVWRLEVQKRGAWHWHGIATHKGDRTMARYLLMTLWHEHVRRLPGVVDYQTVNGKCLWTGSRMSIPGADRVAFESDGGETRGAWLRYLQDHASKAKAEQIPESIGRHWGIVGRSLWRRVGPDRLQTLTRKQWAIFLRQLQRLATPRRKCAAPFGSKRGYRNRRGSVGASVWFSRPETLQRLIVWAKAERGPDDE